MKRLVQIVPHYSPPYVGGMEMRARDRADWLASSGWVVDILTSSGLTYPHTVAESRPTEFVWIEKQTVLKAWVMQGSGNESLTVADNWPFVWQALYRRDVEALR